MLTGSFVTAEAVHSRADVEAFVSCAAEYLEKHGPEEAGRAFREDERWPSSDRGTYILVDGLAASGTQQLFVC